MLQSLLLVVLPTMSIASITCRCTLITGISTPYDSRATLGYGAIHWQTPVGLYLWLNSTPEIIQLLFQPAASRNDLCFGLDRRWLDTLRRMFWQCFWFAVCGFCQDVFWTLVVKLMFPFNIRVGIKEIGWDCFTASMKVSETCATFLFFVPFREFCWHLTKLPCTSWTDWRYRLECMKRTRRTEQDGMFHLRG